MPKANKKQSRLRPFEAMRALEALRELGGIVVVPESVAGRRIQLLSLADTAEMAGMSVDWVRNHLEEFPHAAKVPGGDIRVPIADLEEAVRRWGIHKG